MHHYEISKIYTQYSEIFFGFSVKFYFVHIRYYLDNDAMTSHLKYLYKQETEYSK